MEIKGVRGGNNYEGWTKTDSRMRTARYNE